MSTFDRGPTQRYEITWASGYTEYVDAHQVTWPSNADVLAALMGGSTAEARPRRVVFHAEIDGHWTLLLSANEDDLRSIRNVTQTEASAPPESGDVS